MITASQALKQFKQHNEEHVEKLILDSIEKGKSEFDLGEDFKLQPDLKDKLTKLGYSVNTVPVNQGQPGVSIPQGVSVPMKTTISFELADQVQSEGSIPASQAEQQTQNDANGTPSQGTVGSDAEVPAESECDRKARNADKMVNSTPVKAKAKK